MGSVKNFKVSKRPEERKVSIQVGVLPLTREKLSSIAQQEGLPLSYVTNEQIELAISIREKVIGLATSKGQPVSHVANELIDNALAHMDDNKKAQG
ncbi:hypothetical protein LJB89_04255 [Tyzzerella sp. OttesenSCG-928-J15]|nr:hypothetical protein [Tyzzerella sp. OttesenSCG-928-J15]